MMALSGDIPEERIFIMTHSDFFDQSVEKLRHVDTDEAAIAILLACIAESLAAIADHIEEQMDADD